MISNDPIPETNHSNRSTNGINSTRTNALSKEDAINGIATGSADDSNEETVGHGPQTVDGYSFSAPTETVSVHGILFDFDGTIVDSTTAIVKHWHKQAELMGMDGDVILATSHGRRSIDTFREIDPSRANWEYINEMESQIPIVFGNDAVELPGARKILATLESINAPFAIVTSATSGLLNGWIKILKLGLPKTIVVAEDVDIGKPDPSCYLLGRDRLKLAKDSHVIVIEDAPSGIRAGKAAGFKVIGLATTHRVAQLQDAGADWIVRDLRSVRVNGFKDSIVQIDIENALVWT